MHLDNTSIYDKIDLAIESGDMNRVVEFSKQVPLPPEIALAFKEGFGSDYIRNSGFDLSMAEKVYGSDWLSR